MLWASLAIIVVFGGATLLLQDETFIKWKPTVLYWLFGVVLAGSALLFRRNLIRAMLSEQMRCPTPVWSRLNWSWVGFFAFMGAVNLYVAFNYSDRPVGQLQAVRRHGADAAVRRRAGAVPRQAHRREAVSVSGADIRERLAALEPAERSTWSTRARSTPATPAPAPAATRTGGSPSSRRASPASPPSRATAWSTRRSAS